MRSERPDDLTLTLLEMTALIALVIWIILTVSYLLR